MYVATPQGYRRKIGPRSRYGTTPDGPAYNRTPQRVGSEPQRVGTSNSGIDAHFGSDALRRRKELDDREKADRYLFDQEKRRANQARKREEAQRTEAKTAQDANTASKVADAVAKGESVLSKITGGIGAVLANHRTPAQIREASAKKAAEDRAKGRAKYEAEKSGKAPAPAMAEKKPEPRKHSSPVRDAASKPASKPEPKMVPPHLLFTDRAQQESIPAPKKRAIDSYVSNPANRSVMTGKTRAQEIAEEAADKKKRERENMFRTKYLPNRVRF